MHLEEVDEDLSTDDVVWRFCKRTSQRILEKSSIRKILSVKLYLNVIAESRTANQLLYHEMFPSKKKFAVSKYI